MNNKSDSYHTIENSISSEHKKELEENLLLKSENDLSLLFLSNSIKEEQNNLSLGDLDDDTSSKKLEPNDDNDTVSCKWIKNYFNLKIIDTEESQINNFKDGYNDFFKNSLDVLTSTTLYKLKEYIYNKFHFVGNMFGFKCRACGHPTSSHTSISSVSWKCQDCDEEHNICSLNPEETWKGLSSLIEKLKESI